MRHIFVSAIHISVFAIHIISKNQDFRSPITDVRVSGRPKMTVSGPKWVAVNSNGLKLWENDATGLRIIFKLLFWHSGPKIYQKIKKKNLELNQIGYLISTMVLVPCCSMKMLF